MSLSVPFSVSALSVILNGRLNWHAWYDCLTELAYRAAPVFGPTGVFGFFATDEEWLAIAGHHVLNPEGV
jgi:hypothetical protein